MGRSTKSFARGAAKFKAQATVLVLCEDAKSGKKYFEDAVRHFRVHVAVEVSHCGKTDPKGIVLEAIARQKDFDCVYCAIDRDTHPNFDAAMRLANDHPKLTVIVSYPCFEFWYLLHFGFNRTPYAAAGNKSAGDCLVSDLRKVKGMDQYAKGGDVNMFDLLLPQLPNARRISPQVLAQAEAEDNMNPSTRTHILIDAFEVLASPQPK